ncbi:MAG: MBL fold metallo-hydrolase [Dethiobacter sp.]|nr:MBL fold metallo-hydrolase [Dethiobacter sp.]
MGKIETLAADKRLKLTRLELGPFGTNAYIAVCRETGESVLVDAPGEADLIAAQLKGTSPRLILITHGHADHTLALEELKEKLNIPVASHGAEGSVLPLPPDRLLKDGDEVVCGRLILKVLHTPGHTAGSLCFKVNGFLLAGDTIFPGGPGKTGSPAEFQQILCSITEKIFALPAGTRIFPGHGSSTDVETEQDQYRKFASRSLNLNLYGDVTWL